MEKKDEAKEKPVFVKKNKNKNLRKKQKVSNKEKKR